MNRTPVSTKNHYGSDSNVFVNKESEEKSNNLINRLKRRRDDEDIMDEFKKFKDEIRTMLIEWKSDNDYKLSKLQTDITDVKNTLTDVQKTNFEIEKSLEFLSTQYDDMNLKILNLEESNNEHQQQIKDLQNKIEEFQRLSCVSTLEIRNVPVCVTENQSDLFKIVENVTKAVGADVLLSDINDIRRLPGKPHIKKPIIVKFNTPLLKNKVIKAVKTFNIQNQAEKLNTTHLGISGSPSPIYVVEHLTPTARRLYFLARELMRSKLFKYCWTMNGKVFLRQNDGAPLLHVTSESQVTLLKSGDK